MTYAKRKDANHDEIAAAIRAAGWAWTDTYMFTGGLLDGIAAKDGLNVLVEIKHLRGKLTEREQAIMDDWPGAKIIAFAYSRFFINLSQCIAWCNY